MAAADYCIDIGTSNIKIHVNGIGTLVEPTVVALHKNAGTVTKYFGSEAKKLIGKTPDNISIIYPVFEGRILHFNPAADLLCYLLCKMTPKSILRTKARIIVTVPCGLTTKEKEQYEDLVIRASGPESGIILQDLIMLDAPIAAGYALAEALDAYSTMFLVDIGGGKTDISALTLNGIISGCTFGVGGNNIDSGIIDYINQEYGIIIGTVMAEKIKKQIGSLVPNDGSKTMINGRSKENGNPISMLITSQDINMIIDFYLQRITTVIESALASLNPEVSAEIRDKGLILLGETALIPGIDKYFSKKLQVIISVAENPGLTVISGAAKVISDPYALARVGRS